MIEAGANEVPEDVMIEAIYKAHEVNQEIIKLEEEYKNSEKELQKLLES